MKKYKKTRNKTTYIIIIYDLRISRKLKEQINKNSIYNNNDNIYV